MSLCAKGHDFVFAMNIFVLIGCRIDGMRSKFSFDTTGGMSTMFI